MTLTTDRLYIRSWTDEDAPILYEYCKEPDIGANAGFPPHTSVENSLYVIRNLLLPPEGMAIVLQDTDVPIGSIGLHKATVHETYSEVEIGYWIGKPFWGKGYATEAVMRLVDYIFGELRFDKIWICYFEGNEGSKRVSEKCGFHYDHTTENMEYKNLGTKTLISTVLTREEWIKK